MGLFGLGYVLQPASLRDFKSIRRGFGPRELSGAFPYEVLAHRAGKVGDLKGEVSEVRIDLSSDYRRLRSFSGSLDCVEMDSVGVLYGTIYLDEGRVSGTEWQYRLD